MIKTYQIWAKDCDGEGEVLWAPQFDDEQKAQKFIDEVIFGEEADGDIISAWVEELKENKYCKECNYSWNPNYMHHMCPDVYESERIN